MRRRGRPNRREAEVNGQLALTFGETIEAQCIARAAVRSAGRTRRQNPNDQLVLRLMRFVERRMKVVSRELRSITGELTEFERAA